MPPPLPPEGNPPPRLVQPRLKSKPKLIYFHYDQRANAMVVSPFPTPIYIPRIEPEQSLSTIKQPTDPPMAASTPDLIQKPKVCYVQPPVFEQHHTPVQIQGANQTLPNSNQNSLILNNSVGSTELPSPLHQMKAFNQQHQQPSSSSVPSSPALYPSMQTHSLSPQNYRGPVPINMQAAPLQQSPMQIQSSPMTPQWDSPVFQANSQMPPLQQSPCPQLWEPDPYMHNQPVRSHTRFNSANTQQRPTHNSWDQQRHANPIFQKQVHPAQQPPSFHPRSNHQRFHQNHPINVNPSHPQHNNFAFNAKYNNYGVNSNHSWNHQHRNNH